MKNSNRELPTHRLTRPSSIVIPAWLLLCSCGGTTLATSDAAGSKNDVGTDAGESNDANVATGPLAAECDGVSGLTGQTVLDALNALPQLPAATFSRYVYPAGPPSTNDPTALTIQIRYENGAVVCNPAVPDPPGTPNPGVTPASVDITVQVDFVTADGAFAESFPAALSGAGGTGLEFTGNVAVADIKGSYRYVAQTDTEGAATNVTFFGMLNGPDLAGTYVGGVVHGGAYGQFKFN